jgi:hypothetical protein
MIATQAVDNRARLNSLESEFASLQRESGNMTANMLQATRDKDAGRLIQLKRRGAELPGLIEEIETEIGILRLTVAEENYSHAKTEHARIEQEGIEKARLIAQEMEQMRQRNVELQQQQFQINLANTSAYNARKLAEDRLRDARADLGIGERWPVLA